MSLQRSMMKTRPLPSFGARMPIVVVAEQAAGEAPGRDLFDQVGAVRAAGALEALQLAAALASRRMDNSPRARPVHLVVPVARSDEAAAIIATALAGGDSELAPAACASLLDCYGVALDPTASRPPAQAAFRLGVDADPRFGPVLRFGRAARPLPEAPARLCPLDEDDAVAFKLVQDHFDVLVPIIERRGGAVVKTIGDAVMAVFSDELAGLAASREILAEFQKFRAATRERQRTNLKLGFYSGPCFVLTANKVLDYFGQTVNIAARLQGQARGGELIIEERFADEAIRAGALTASEVIERSTPVLKGVEQSIRVARITVGANVEIDAA